MENNYSKLLTSTEPTQRETNFTLDKDNYETIEFEDVKKEDAIFEVFKAKEYTSTVSGIIQAIDNYYNEVECYDDYPYFRIQNTNKYIPKLNETSEILTERQLRELHSHLPYYQQFKNLKLLYSTKRNGILLNTLYHRAEDAKNYILLIKTTDGDVFGTYISENLHKHHRFYGTGECFLFTYFTTERIHVFPSTGHNEYFIFTNDEMLAFGCSDKNFGLNIDGELLTGYSRRTDTYKNPPLSSTEYFYINVLELWTFDC
jgi:hypothetical protein